MHTRSLAMVTLLLLLSVIQPVFSREDCTVQWTFELRTDRSVHVKALIPVEEGMTSYTITGFPTEPWICDLRTYEYRSQTPIESKVRYDSTLRMQRIILTFDEPTPESFRFVVEFDARDYLEEADEKAFTFFWDFDYTFFWYSDPDEERFNSAAVILPKGAELLEVDLTPPKKVEENEQVSIYYEGVSGPSAWFKVQVTFSHTGKDYQTYAEQYHQSQTYDLAISYYRKAQSFYQRFTLYEKDKSLILAQLQEQIFVIQQVQADTAFQEGVAAYGQKAYAAAQVHFEQAEPLYTILKDAEGQAACEDMITECERIQDLEKKADNLFEQGKSYYETKVYIEAVKTFHKARDIYGELENENRVSECDEWLVICDKAAGVGVPCCILGIVAGLSWRRYT